jgi:hypothetical protein
VLATEVVGKLFCRSIGSRLAVAAAADGAEEEEDEAVADVFGLPPFCLITSSTRSSFSEIREREFSYWDFRQLEN